MRFVAIGDSFTEGVGDELPDGRVRGWADIAAQGWADAAGEPIEYANLAIRGKLIEPIVAEQLREDAIDPGLAAAHKPDVLGVLQVLLGDLVVADEPHDLVRFRRDRQALVDANRGNLRDARYAARDRGVDIGTKRRQRAGIRRRVSRCELSPAREQPAEIARHRAVQRAAEGFQFGHRNGLSRGWTRGRTARRGALP